MHVSVKCEVFEHSSLTKYVGQDTAAEYRRPHLANRLLPSAQLHHWTTKCIQQQDGKEESDVVKRPLRQTHAFSCLAVQTQHETARTSTHLDIIWTSLGAERQPGRRNGGEGARRSCFVAGRQATENGRSGVPNAALDDAIWRTFSVVAATRLVS